VTARTENLGYQERERTVTLADKHLQEEENGSRVGKMMEVCPSNTSGVGGSNCQKSKGKGWGGPP
jgi:hypothetical protein